MWSCPSKHGSLIIPFKYEDFLRNSVRTSHYVSATEPNRLMLFRETVAVYCENHMEHINALYGQNAEYLNVKVCGIYSYHCDLKGSILRIAYTAYARRKAFLRYGNGYIYQPLHAK
jgi:hypothetical protein